MAEMTGDEKLMEELEMIKADDSKMIGIRGPFVLIKGGS
jgi:hypothetical protein